MLAPSERTGLHPSIDGKFGPTVGHLLRRVFETPIPQDFAGFTHQVHHQASGMTSYLFGERRETGWRHYYLVATAVKVPLLFFLALIGRWVFARRIKFALFGAGLGVTDHDLGIPGDSLHRVKATSVSGICYRSHHWQSSGYRAWPRGAAGPDAWSGSV